MKNFRNAIAALLAALLAMTSCSIEKRHYRPGYSLQWKTGAFTNEPTSPLVNEEPAIRSKVQIETPPVALRNNEQKATTHTPANTLVSPGVPNRTEVNVNTNTLHVQQQKSSLVIYPDRETKTIIKEKKDPGVEEAEDAFIFGIIALAGFLVFPFIVIWPAIIAIKRGKRALLTYTGDDVKVKRNAKDGRLMGTIALVLWSFMLALLILVFAVIFAL